MKVLLLNGSPNVNGNTARALEEMRKIFEEENIEGKLYNEDGTEYKEPKKTVTVKPKTTKSTVKTSPTTIEPTMDLFSMAEKGVSEICESLENKNQGVQAETSVHLPSSVKKKLPKGVSEDQMSLFDF